MRTSFSIKRALLGRPIATAEEEAHRLSKKIALPVFASDAISSTAYATEEILLILVAAGAAALSYALGFLLIGVTWLAHVLRVTPVEGQTVLSEIGRAVYGNGNPLYFLLQIATMMILVLAANTSFNGFPRLAAILAERGFLPRQFMNRGDRLVFSNGIVGLTLLAIVLLIVFRANVNAMIPLYAVGVFTSFTISQAGWSSTGTGCGTSRAAGVGARRSTGWGRP